MKKLLSCIGAWIMCAAMLSGCGSKENTIQTGNASDAETTASMEEEISYQKKRVVYYPIDGESYIREDYEYYDGGYYKNVYFDDGTLFGCTEYKNDIMIKSTTYGKDGLIFSVSEYDESEFNNMIKNSSYDNERLSFEFIYDYQFNDDRTEALETVTTIFYDPDTGEKIEGSELDIDFKYIQKYEYDEAGRIIHECEYNKDTGSVTYEYYYEYDDNGNEILQKSEDAIITSEYDNSNNLIHMHNSNGNRDIYYDYDEYGRQIGWTFYDADGNETSHCVVEYE